MLSARATLQAQYAKLHKAVLAIVGEDAVCRRLITVPGVGRVVAVTFKSAVDDPSRIAKSKAVGALFGLTPKKYQSGETELRCLGSRSIHKQWARPQRIRRRIRTAIGT
jgi:transposase